MAAIDVSIIVVSYNTRDLTLACLRSIDEHTTSCDYGVIVIDNASSDGSHDAIAREFPHVVLLRADTNLGFARANNLAAEHVRAPYTLLLNPDTYVIDDAIGVLLVFAREHPEARIYGGRTLFPDGSLNRTSAWGAPSLWSIMCRGTGLGQLFKRSRLFNPEDMPGWEHDTVREVATICGCFLLVETQLCRDLDGFDPRLTMYAEEVDFCLRARRRGARPTFNPASTIVHYGGASERVKADQVVRQFVAKVKLFRKHWNPASAWFGTRMLDLWAANKLVRAWVLHRIGRPGKDPLDTWFAIWRRRAEWRTAWTESDKAIA